MAIVMEICMHQLLHGIPAPLCSHLYKVKTWLLSCMAATAADNSDIFKCRVLAAFG